MNFFAVLVLGLGFGLMFEFGKMLALALVSTTSMRDSTDPEKGHSGLTLLKDHGTGVEYLMSPTGHLTPRLERSEILLEKSLDT